MSKLSVLVIEEDLKTRQMVAKEVLRPHGFAVDTASSSIEGLRKAISGAKDLIIMSLEMSRVSGLEILREIRNFDTTVPVIIMTSGKVSEITLEVLRLGVYDYIEKPVDPDELLDAVENAICLPELQHQKRELFTRNVIQMNQRLEKRIQNLNTLYRISKSITSRMEPDKILERIVDAVLFILEGEACTLMLLDPKTAKVKNHFEKRRSFDPVRYQAARYENETETGPTESVLSVPLQVGEIVVGLLSLSKLVSGRFTSHDAQSLRMLADYAALAIHNVELSKQLDTLREREKQRLRTIFDSYVTPTVIEQILDEPAQFKLDGSRQKIAILYAHIRGFSTFSSRKSPETLIRLLNQYLRVAREAILAEEGTVAGLTGDDLLAIFNSPLPQTDYPLRALRVAWMIRETVMLLHARLPKEHQFHFGIGVGVGQALVGYIGTGQAVHFTAMGDTVNKVKHLQEQAKAGQILIDHDTFRVVQQDIQTRYLGDLQLKGQSQAEPIYEVIRVGDY